VQIDEKNPNDVATEPHEPTHICDSLRYFCVNFTCSAKNPPVERIFNFSFEKPQPNPIGRGDRQSVI
jgi:hypothetical protein